MNATDKVKYLVLAKAAEWNEDFAMPDFEADAIDAAYDALTEAEDHYDAESEVRGGEVETGLPCERSRHYESKAVAARLPDGSWVGWTYWYGGGKHGEPEAIDWIGEAYDLTCIEEEKVVTVRTFAKQEQPA